METPETQLIEPVKLTLINFLSQHLRQEIEQNLSHEQIQKAIALEEVKQGNNNYQKQTLNFTQKNLIDDQLKNTQDKIITDIMAFNEQIKIDDTLFREIFALRERKALSDSGEALQDRLNKTYKLFDY